ncbi:MAG: PrsW family intramembrane metalloprotease [Anaerolineae bacterium]
MSDPIEHEHTSEKIEPIHPEHAPYAINRNRSSFWTSNAIVMALVIVFALLVQLAASWLDITLGPSGMLAASIVLTVIPVALWMTAFYLLDRDEPEPRTYVLGILLLGGFAALTVGNPIVRNLFRVQEWIGLTPWYVQLLASVFIVGFVQEYCKYAVVRYTIFFNREFDERIDGIIYGAAAGLGFGSILAVQHLIQAGGAQLGVAAVRIAITTLAQASFGGFTGYFIGRAKFDNMGKWWLPAGLSLAALLNGLVTWILGEVSTQGLAFTPLYSLVAAGVTALVVFTFLAFQTGRLARMQSL